MRPGILIRFILSPIVWGFIGWLDPDVKPTLWGFSFTTRASHSPRIVSSNLQDPFFVIWTIVGQTNVDYDYTVMIVMIVTQSNQKSIWFLAPLSIGDGAWRVVMGR